MPKEIYESLAVEAERVAFELRLRIGGVTRLAGALRFDNMIGTIATPRGSIEIAPKTRPGQNWLRSVVDLFDERPVSLADDVPASDRRSTTTFREMIANIYARRLSRALLAEGPITTIEAERHRSSMLSGRLRVEEWIRTVAYAPHIFPVERQSLTRVNAFSQTLAHVAEILMPAIADPVLRRQLQSAVDQLTDGRDVSGPAPDAIDLPLPDQWGAYLPAWTIAQLVLKRLSPMGERPSAHGISFAIEPWVLLERLLERTLTSLSSMLTTESVRFTSKAQVQRTFLAGKLNDNRKRVLYPDCILLRDGMPFVNFEAKYRDYGLANAPKRAESYQALTAGRALGTSIAVIVYPNANDPEILDVLERGHRPDTLAVMGLNLFDYQRGAENGLAEKMRRLLENVTGTDTLEHKGATA